jgi:membrane complex biogenesis BtpA family protein
MTSPDLLGRRPLLLGVVHLQPLPGAPGHRPGSPWRRRAASDARAYAEAGFDGVLVENFGDAPFFAGRVPPETSASLAVAAHAVRDAVPPAVAVAVNVLRNDGRAAVAIAAAAGLDFVRINVLAGAFVTDQGLVEGEAAQLLRDRARLAPHLKILADVRVKHAAPLAPRPIEEEALDLVERAGADALIVTGSRTGRAVDREELASLRKALPEAFLLVGSGTSRHTVRGLLADADGAIVGSAVKRGGRTDAPVDKRRAAAFVHAARG